jgi:hypothetical protein
MTKILVYGAGPGSLWIPATRRPGRPFARRRRNAWSWQSAQHLVHVCAPLSKSAVGMRRTEVPHRLL